MSWIDKIKEGMIITTGDGKQYRPDWLNANLEVEYNYAEYAFVDVGGSNVDRRDPLGTRYTLELYFQGDDNLDVAKAFRISCNNRKPWILEHPLYDTLTVAIIKLAQDNSGMNVSKIIASVVETLEEVPISNLFKTTAEDVPELMAQAAESAAQAVTAVPTPTDINRLSNDNLRVYKTGIPIISDTSDFQKYTNYYNTANTYINTATATPLLAMRYTISAIQAPAFFKATVDQRLKVLFKTFDDLRANIAGLLTVSAKQIFAAQQSSCLAAACLAATTPNGQEYKTGNQVLDVLEKISGRYGQMRSDLDGLQAANAGNPLSFVADGQMIMDLDEVVNTTVNNLFTVALGAKSERRVIVQKETNIIQLTHLLYGLQNPSAMDELMENNGIGINELLQIGKDREIVYYV